MANVCDSFCDNCHYRGKINGQETHCAYMFKTNELRPCDPGKGCTVKVPIKVMRRKKK